MLTNLRMTGPTYLHECARLHGRLLQSLSGRAQDLTQVEKAVVAVRSRGTLHYSDVRAIIESPHFSAGTRYWAWPTREDIETGLQDQKLALWSLPKNERAVITRLRTVFKTTDAVSVILRFVVPHDYGIQSEPVEHMLGIQPSVNSVERYLAYAADLRTIRDRYKFDAAAQVDQALWTLHIGVHRGKLEGLADVDRLKRAHARDRFLQSIRIKNLANALIGKMNQLDLADALSEHRPDLAGQLAAIEFERATREYAKAHVDAALRTVIKQSAPSHLLGHWNWCCSRRNDAVHRRPLDQREVQELIQHTRGIAALPRVRR